MSNKNALNKDYQKAGEQHKSILSTVTPGIHIEHIRQQVDIKPWWGIDINTGGIPRESTPSCNLRHCTGFQINLWVAAVMHLLIKTPILQSCKWGDSQIVTDGASSLRNNRFKFKNLARSLVDLENYRIYLTIIKENLTISICNDWTWIPINYAQNLSRTLRQLYKRKASCYRYMTLDLSPQTEAHFLKIQGVDVEVYLNLAGEKTPIQSVSLAPTGFLNVTVTHSAVSPCQHKEGIIMVCDAK